MSYYQGDFYQGDPGFFGFLKGALTSAAGMVPGVGGVAGKLVSKMGGSGGAGALVRRVGTSMLKHPVLSAAGAAGLVGAAGTGVGRLTSRAGSAGVGPMAQMRGFHISKKSGKVVRNRRMRVTNTRALRRAIRRCTGFAHLAKRVLRFTSPRPPRGRAVFKHARRTRKRLAA